ncbi:MAG: glycosyltransferase family 1 protein [Anaerolineae bacterium]
MLIGIDASRATLSRRTGTEGYSLHLIRGLIQVGDAHRFRLYLREPPPSGLFPLDERVELRLIDRARLWTHTGLGPVVRRERPDVLFVPAHVIPWPGVGGVPAVVTLHDLGYLHYPDKHPLAERLYLNWSTRHSAGVARRVIAHSQATAHDLMALNGVPGDKIRVVYSGVDEQLKPVTNPEALEQVRARLGIPGPYILHVGRVEPRKNLVRLVEAFARVRETLGDLWLVLAGSVNRRYTALTARIRDLGLERQVILPGYVPDDLMAGLFSGAEVFAFPSLYEGFGFPVLEAMACGTPVVCSNTSSLPEVVGDAALTVAPTDTASLAEGLLRVLLDEALRQELVGRGFVRVRLFNWETCSRETLAVLHEAASI